MAMVNVNRENSDPYYRYKMPRLMAKIEGKGNGIKTVVVNMVDIAKSLGRPPSYPCKYFGCELGAQTQMDAKSERYIVNGAHDGDRLQELLDGFIKKFVLCPDCENPETVLHVDKKKAIHQVCHACGYQGVIGSRHKLTTFIQNHPPDNASAGKKEKEKDKEKEKKEKRSERHKGSKDQKKEETNGDVAGARKRDDGDDFEKWSADTSEEAVRDRMKELSSNAASLTVTADTEQPLASRMQEFFAFVKGRKGQLLKDSKLVLSEAKRLDVFDKGAMVVAEVVFNKDILKQIKAHKNLLLRFVHENKKAQKYLLGALEQIIGVDHPELMSQVPYILKALYDEDILDEDVILEWDQKVSKKYVDKKISAEIHEKASPFIKWLREAEEETSDEEDVEVVYTTKPEEVKKAAEEKDDDKADDADDIDIDDI